MHLPRVLFLLAIPLQLCSLWAQEPSRQDIASMIQAIKTAPADQRYKKVNAFKIMLRSLNQKNRMEALHKLQQNQPMPPPQMFRPPMGEQRPLPLHNIPMQQKISPSTANPLPLQPPQRPRRGEL